MKRLFSRAGRAAAFCGSFFLSACAGFAQKGGDVLPGYGPLSAAVIVSLPPELAEISGIAYDAATNSVFAVTDEVGILFRFPLAAGGALERYPFGGPGDYEALQYVRGMFYALRSNGDVIRMTWNGGPGTGGVIAQTEKGSFDGGVEFESLYYDPARAALVLLCKQCKDDGDKSVAAYTFDPSKTRFAKAGFKLKTGGVKGLKKDERLRPSDAAIHPKTGELYILGSVNNLLVVADPQTGAVKKSYRLDKDLYKQPEGIAFTPEGDLIISNEAAGKGSATLLRLAYKP